MVRKYFFLAILLIAGGLVLNSCTKEELSSKKEILSFVFEASKNAELEHNVIGTINGTEITADVPFGTTISNLIPNIEISPRASISPNTGVVMDFSSPVTFTVTAEDGTTKQFSTIISIEPAPYIGTWEGGPIDFGLGLMHVKVVIDETGDLTMELKEILTQDLNNQSIKGAFDPLGEPNIELMINQTHRWVNSNWNPEVALRTMMYQFDQTGKMRFFYCICYPRQDWWFQIDLLKE